MKSLLLVALGGGLGSMARYSLSAWVLHHTIAWKFPLGTFVVNVLGCFIAGLLAGLAERYEFFPAEARLLIFTGLLGGFTTFSAFGLETIFLFRRGEVLVAGTYVAASVLIGLLAFWLALKAIMLLGR
jgi:CrcB protein